MLSQISVIKNTHTSLIVKEDVFSDDIKEVLAVARQSGETQGISAEALLRNMEKQLSLPNNLREKNYARQNRKNGVNLVLENKLLRHPSS